MARIFGMLLFFFCAASSVQALEIIVDTSERRLYLVDSGQVVKHYPVAVGAPGNEWSDTRIIHNKYRWPAWRKSPNHPTIPSGAPNNPMGAAALMLGSGPDAYAIHGTNRPNLIGQAVSRGCIRMHNRDVEDLFTRVPIGTVVRVLD